MTPYTSPNPPAHSLKPLPAPPTDLLVAILSGDPEAALPLHSYYAAGIEAHVRRKRPDLDLPHSALEILLEVIRHVRAEQTSLPVNLTALVLRSTRAYLARQPHRPAIDRPPAVSLALKCRADLVNHLFSRLPALEREVIMRTYLLQQDDASIAREMSIQPNRPAAIRAHLRRMVRTTALRTDAKIPFSTSRLVAIH